MNGSPGIIPEADKPARRGPGGRGPREQERRRPTESSAPCARFSHPNRTLSLKTGPSVGSSIGEVKESGTVYTPLLPARRSADRPHQLGFIVRLGECDGGEKARQP